MFQLWTLVGVLTGIAVIALLVMVIGVDDVQPLKADDQIKKGTCMTSSLRSLKSIITHSLNRTQMLLIPHTILLDLSKAFFRGDFNKVGSVFTHD